MNDWEVAEWGPEPRLQMTALSSWCPIVFRGSKGGNRASPALFPPKHHDPNMPSPLRQPSRAPQPSQKTCCFPSSTCHRAVLSPVGDCLPNVCLYHHTVSSLRGGALFFSPLYPHLYPLNKYLLSTHCMTATVAGSRDITVNKNDRNCCPLELTS